MPYSLSAEGFAAHFSDENIAKYDRDITTAQHIPRPPHSRYVIPPKYLIGRSADRNRSNDRSKKDAEDKSQITLNLGVPALISLKPPTKKSFTGKSPSEISDSTLSPTRGVSAYSLVT